MICSNVFKEIYAYQGCIYLIKNTITVIKTVILWNIFKMINLIQNKSCIHAMFTVYIYVYI